MEELSPKCEEMPDVKRVAEVPLEQSDSDLHRQGEDWEGRDEIQSLGGQSQMCEKLTDVQRVTEGPCEMQSDSDYLGRVV